jgi:hypothetical protein
MRTTLDIDDDVLQVAKEIAATQGTTMGKAVSDLARKGLAPTRPKVRIRNGVPLLGPRKPTDRPLTTQLVNELRDEEP